jgi:hypothetical protein
MSLVDHTQEVIIDFAWEKVLSAVEKAIPNIKGMKIDSVNKITKTISLKAGISLFSWGENLTVTLTPLEGDKTKVSILSTPKTGVMLGGAMDMGKNRKNISMIFDEMSKNLK